MHLRGLCFVEKYTSMMKSKNKGAVSVYVLTIVLIACLIVPVFSTLVNKQLAYATLTEMWDLVHMSAMSAYQEIDVLEASEGRIALDEERTIERIRLAITENIKNSGKDAVLVDLVLLDNPGVHVVLNVNLSKTGQEWVTAKKDISFPVNN